MNHSSRLKSLFHRHSLFLIQFHPPAKPYTSPPNFLQPTTPVDPTKTLFQILSQSPKLALEKELDDSGIAPSHDVVETVLARFANAGMISYRFFSWASKKRNFTHSVISYHTIIASLAKIRQYKLMWDLVADMHRNRLLNIEIFCLIIRKYARAQKLDEAIYTFNVMEKYGITPNSAAFNGLLTALCKSKNVRKAQEIFDSTKSDSFSPDSKTYTVLLEGWGKEPNLPMATEIYQEMIAKGIEPDIVTYSIMVDVLCKAGRLEGALEVIEDMKSRNCPLNSYVYSILIHTYGTEKRIAEAVETFLEMERDGIEADVATYNSLISGFVRANKFQNVDRVLLEMENKGVSPNSRTCNVILTGLIRNGETDEAFRFFRRMIKQCDPDSDTYTMMIKMFCDCDRLGMALKVWKYMEVKQFAPSMHTFSVLINGLCRKGELNKACALLEEMLEKGIRPPRTTFKRLKQLLVKEKRDDVLEFLEEKMKLLVKEPLND